MSYATRTDLETRFGRVNLAQWADLDNDQDQATITARISSALDVADGQIDATLAAAGYALPLSGTSAAGTAMLREIAVGLAGSDLWNSRGASDQETEGGGEKQYGPAKAEARNKLALIAAGSLDIGAARSGYSVPGGKGYWPGSTAILGDPDSLRNRG